MSKRAVVLAGGRGTRLRPYTVALPKPLMPIGELPILEIIIRQLARHGFGHITLAVNHQAELLRAYFANGEKWDVRLDYSLEREALSTMAPLKLVTNLPEDFIVMNGDVLTDLHLGKFFEQHLLGKNLFTISAARRSQRVDYGVLHIDNRNQLVAFEEKPSLPYLVSMGIYAANRKILETIPSGRAFGFDHLLEVFLRSRQAVPVLIHDGYWLDIGRPDDYQRATEEWPALEARILG